MIQVIIIEKLLLVGEVLATLLRDEPGIRVVGLVPGITQAFEYLKAMRCDVVILGNSFSTLKTLKMTLQIAENFPATRIVIFSTLEADASASPYLEAGAFGYICNEHSPDELLQVVRSTVSMPTPQATYLAPHSSPT